MDSLLSGLKDKPYKVARTDGNVANRIGAHLRAKWPELVNIPGLWFSGSQVWSFLYGEEPSETSDTDVFIVDSDTRPHSELPVWHPKNLLLKELGVVWNDGVDKHPRTGEAGTTYAKDGRSWNTAKGAIDLWTSPTSAQDALRNYPTASHAHCRAAFSFTEGLVVLPNELTDQPAPVDGPADIGF